MHNEILSRHKNSTHSLSTQDQTTQPKKKLRRYLDDAVEDDVVVVAATRELDEVPASLGRVLVVHLRIE